MLLCPLLATKAGTGWKERREKIGERINPKVAADEREFQKENTSGERTYHKTVKFSPR
jgi:hypothetical protein